MKFDDRIKYMISGYYGIKTLDSYPRKLFILKEIEEHIKDYLKTNKVEGYDYKKLAEELKNRSLKEKLQDSLILINEMNGPIDLTIIIKRMVKDLRMNDK